MTDAQTQLVGLIGWPVEHSVSPAMHNAAFQAVGLNWHYVPLAVRSGEVKDAVRGLAALGFRGANVTVPHKRSVWSLLDAVAAPAQELGAVNTLVIRRKEDGRAVIEGHNTDCEGFVGALRQSGIPPAGIRYAVVAGAGGGARAVVYSLLRAGTGKVLLLNRSLERARALVSALGRHADGGTVLRVTALTGDALVDAARQADLLVNATPVGMWPRVDDSIWPDGVPLPPHLTVLDLVYNPQVTRLLQQARASGAHSIDGLGMLIGQGARAFELWTGLEAPVDVMRAACERALGRE